MSSHSWFGIQIYSRNHITPQFFKFLIRKNLQIRFKKNLVFAFLSSLQHDSSTYPEILDFIDYSTSITWNLNTRQAFNTIRFILLILLAFNTIRFIPLILLAFNTLRFILLILLAFNTIRFILLILLAFNTIRFILLILLAL